MRSFQVLRLNVNKKMTLSLKCLLVKIVLGGCWEMVII